MFWKGMSFLYFFPRMLVRDGRKLWATVAPIASAVENLAAGGSTSSPYNVRDCSLHFIPNCCR